MLEVLNPATEEVVDRLEPATEGDADAAIVRAREAYPAWRALEPADRSRLLRRLADALDSEHENLRNWSRRTRAAHRRLPRRDGVVAETVHYTRDAGEIARRHPRRLLCCRRHAPRTSAGVGSSSHELPLTSELEWPRRCRREHARPQQAGLTPLTPSSSGASARGGIPGASSRLVVLEQRERGSSSIRTSPRSPHRSTEVGKGTGGAQTP